MSSHLIIRMDIDAWSELRSALVNGALDRYNMSLIQQMGVGLYSPDRYAKRIENLDIAAHNVLNAQSEEAFLRLNKPVMTNDEWIKAANFMVADAEERLAQAPGGFMRNYLEAQRSLARAYFAADGSNQKMMREMFHAIFWRAHARRVTLENLK